MSDHDPDHCLFSHLLALAWACGKEGHQDQATFAMQHIAGEMWLHLGRGGREEVLRSEATIKTMLYGGSEAVLREVLEIRDEDEVDWTDPAVEARLTEKVARLSLAEVEALVAKLAA